MKHKIIPVNLDFYKKSEKTVKKIVLDNLSEFKNVKVFLFGSRVSNYCPFNSDIDIAILPEKDFDAKIIYKIKDIIEESYVPFKVDIVNLRNVDEEFKRIALKKVKTWR